MTTKMSSKIFEENARLYFIQEVAPQQLKGLSATCVDSKTVKTPEGYAGYVVLNSQVRETVDVFIPIVMTETCKLLGFESRYEESDLVSG